MQCRYLVVEGISTLIEAAQMIAGHQLQGQGGHEGCLILEVFANLPDTLPGYFILGRKIQCRKNRIIRIVFLRKKPAVDLGR